MKWAGIGGTQTQKEVVPKKHTLFIQVEKYFKDVNQDQKVAPDLLESIMKPSGLVKEELRRILFKIVQFRSKI